jgi:phage repressor protein C with HTH and peptisase S24 domain
MSKKRLSSDLGFGKRLQCAMNSRGIKATELSKKLGWSFATLQAYLLTDPEKVSEPSPSRALALANELNVDVAELLFGRNKRTYGTASIPVYSIRAAAGPGIENFSEDVLYEIAFRLDWLKAEVRDVSKLAAVQARGTSMQPLIDDNDLVLIDRARRDARKDPGIFLVRFDGGLSLKTVQRKSQYEVELISANPAHGPIAFNLSGGQIDFDVIGRAIWVGHKM